MSDILEGAALENFFHCWIVGITGMDNAVVRPSIQPEPPNIPNAYTAWMAFRFEDVSSDTYPAIIHSYVTGGTPPVQIGQDELQRQETFDVVCSFYDLGQGGQARSLAKLLRDGTAISQNLEPLFLAGMGFVQCFQPIPVPSLLKSRWLYRLDMSIRIRRVIVRDYPVLDLISVPVQTNVQASDDFTITTTVTK